MHMTASKPFVPRTLDPDKAPRPPRHHQPPPEKFDKPILIPSNRKAAFQWPPELSVPFSDRIGDRGRGGDA